MWAATVQKSGKVAKTSRHKCPRGQINGNFVREVSVCTSKARMPEFCTHTFSEQTCPYFAHWVNKRQLECLYAVRRHQCLTCANRHFMFAFDLHICALAFLRLFPIFCTVAAHKCLVPVWAIYRHFCPLFSIFVCRFSICVG